MQALDIQTTRLLNVLGNKNVKRVTSVGPEQEYFLVDEEKYKTEKRLDLHWTYIRSNASKRSGNG